MRAAIAPRDIIRLGARDRLVITRVSAPDKLKLRGGPTEKLAR